MSTLNGFYRVQSCTGRWEEHIHTPNLGCQKVASECVREWKRNEREWRNEWTTIISLHYCMSLLVHRLWFSYQLKPEFYSALAWLSLGVWTSFFFVIIFFDSRTIVRCGDPIRWWRGLLLTMVFDRFKSLWMSPCSWKIVVWLNKSVHRLGR